MPTAHQKLDAEPVTKFPLTVSFRPETGERPTPIHANYFHFSHFGSEIQMLVCYADVETVVAKATKSGGAPVQASAEVLSRIVLSANGLALLYHSLGAIVKNLPPGTLPETGQLK